MAFLDSIDIGDFVKSIAPDLISAAGAGIGAAVSGSDNKSIAGNYAAGTRESADLLKQGYDAQLGHIEEGTDYLRQLYDAGLIDYTDLVQGAAGEYGTQIQRNVGDYSGYLLPQYDEYGKLIMAADKQYGADIGEAERSAATLLQQGQEDFSAAYAPYTEGGDRAMEYLLQVMATNPEQLTPSQLRMVEDYRRNAIARVAASGLRGSGRGGIAAVNEGDAALAADLYDINQRRADSAATALSNYGYGASGAVAGNNQAVANALTDLRYKTGGLQATNTLNSASTVAGTGMNLVQDFANKGLSAADKAAEAQYGTTRDVAGAVGDYYGNVAGVEGGRFQARADTDFGKALADSGAAARITTANSTAQTDSAKSKNAAIGQITTVLSDAAKKALAKDNDKSVSYA